MRYKIEKRTRGYKQGNISKNPMPILGKWETLLLPDENYTPNKFAYENLEHAKTYAAASATKTLETRVVDQDDLVVAHYIVGNAPLHDVVAILKDVKHDRNISEAYYLAICAKLGLGREATIDQVLETLDGICAI